MKRLWIMRHGEAAQGTPDSRRELTQRGRDEVSSMAKWLAASLDTSRDRLRILASPYVRAQQTAAIVAEQLGTQVESLAMITPDDPVQPVIEWLQEDAQQGPLLLISHMPLVGRLSGRLVEGDLRSSLRMQTAAIAALQAEVWAAGCAELLDFRSPADI
ncbi:phosphohistidine phosphatase SixA [Halomonas sp. M20]|uniref:phosphohistidine phosphatase SixA n=1 Tax=Halomonas sp. M20 TaxID=2763264 RepID=UPI001D0A4933|nr:phosphohistidine phosphatase SixA [Halomonas sp. M20]